MRTELEEIKTLEAFLQARLPEEQQQDIEIRLLWDREWRQQVEAQQLAYNAIREAGRQQLRQELHAIHRRLFG